MECRKTQALRSESIREKVVTTMSFPGSALIFTHKSALDTELWDATRVSLPRRGRP